ncbi:MAG: leucine-rich repeat domain-containing protein [Lachnospiraceae bacterium]|nr:leucine-rich repeat domain-containing protein [Lachnospiraceae bacterium]
MNFKDSIKIGSSLKYNEMLNGKTPLPYSYIPEIESFAQFENNRNNYFKRLEHDQKCYNDCLFQIRCRRDERLRRERDVERQKTERRAHIKFVRNEWLKTLAFNLTTIILLVVSLVLVYNPSLILNHVHFGWVIGVYAVAFVASVITAGVVVGKSDRGASYEFVKQRCAIMIAGAMLFSVLMSIGIAFAPERLNREQYNNFLDKYDKVIDGIDGNIFSCTFFDAKTINSFINSATEVNISGTIRITFANNFVASKGLSIKNGTVVGLGECTDRYVFFDKPINEFAFDGSSYPKTVFFIEGCNSIGQRAFRNCENLDRAYFLQTNIPAIGGGLFSYTWNSSNFKICVPENLLNAYKKVNSDYWYQLSDSQYLSIRYPVSISF